VEAGAGQPGDDRLDGRRDIAGVGIDADDPGRFGDVDIAVSACQDGAGPIEAGQDDGRLPWPVETDAEQAAPIRQPRAHVGDVEIAIVLGDAAREAEARPDEADAGAGSSGERNPG